MPPFSHLAVALALLSACSPMLEVHGGPLGAVDVSHARTASIGEPNVGPPGYASGSRAEEVARRAGVFAATILSAKGYSVQPDGGELLVRIGAGRRQSTVPLLLPVPLPSALQAGQIEATERQDVAEGALVLDVFDRATGAFIWHGAARVVIDPSAIDDALLQRATSAILAKFPPRKVTP